MGAREFTDEAERTRRRECVRRVGDAAFGQRIGRESNEAGHKGTWHADLARAISQATGREIGRARVAQWLLTGDDAKPVPAWAMAALPAIAAAAAAELRARADALDAEASEAGNPPVSQGEPEASRETLQESGPASAQAVSEEDFDAALGAFADAVASEPPRRLDGEDAMPTAADVETRLTWSSAYGWSRQPAHPLGR